MKRKELIAYFEKVIAEMEEHGIICVDIKYLLTKKEDKDNEVKN